MPGVVDIAKVIASNPASLLLVVPVLPTLALVWLIYRMHVQNDRNFREVIKVIREVSRTISENTTALGRVNDREDEHDRKRRH